MSTSWHWLKKHQLSGKIFSEQLPKLHSTCVSDLFRQTIVLKFVFIFGPSAKNLQPFGKRLSAGLSNLHFSCPWNRFGKNDFSEKKNKEFLFFGHGTKSYRNCLLCVHMDHFGRIFHLKQLHTHKSFLDIRQNVICFLSIVLRKCCQNCFLSVHRIILRKLFFEKKMLLNLGFGKLAKIYRLSQKKSIKLPKLSSTRPKGSFA